MPALVIHEILAGHDEHAQRMRTALARAVSGVLCALVSPADPRVIVIGGEWGLSPTLIRDIEQHFGRTPRPVPVTAATLPAPELRAARVRAVEELRSLIIRSARPARA
ncbi:hypothetical protein [Streptomyces sp. MK7]|uniref:hypothetical protein n=1 Tax=Streptomyces sp. MK7 TaxID=3067635 RepID=UPI00292EE687|nr:hypothetical protein [Streptomyces sp. MK7]